MTEKTEPGNQTKGAEEPDFKPPLTFEEIKEKTEKFILPTYKRAPVAFYFGQGDCLIDTEHREYLDFLSGIAVTSLGHGEADLTEAIRDQTDRLIHTSNLFYNEEQALLAEVLVNHSFPSQAFFCNSGTEANEAAFKLARSYGQKAKGGAFGIISLEKSFHGRTLAGITLTGQEKIHSGFGPLPPGVKHLPANDLEMLEREIEDNGTNICALFLELVQGEGGVRPLDTEYVTEARRLTRENDILLVIDEIQTGIGRTGKLFAFEHYNIKPDVMTLAKALAGGIPIGAMLVASKFTKYLGAGQHGATFGGNHLSSRAAFETLRIIIGRELLKNVNGISDYMMTRLQALKIELTAIKDVRGLGFMIGIELDRDGADLVTMCRENGLLVNCAANKVIRLLPPLNITLERAGEGLDILEEQLRKFLAG